MTAAIGRPCPAFQVEEGAVLRGIRRVGDGLGVTLLDHRRVHVQVAHIHVPQQPPVLVLRLRRKLRREAIVAALVERLGLDPAKSRKVAGYYADLEVGVLDPEPVDRRVWDVLADVLEANVRALAGLRLPPLATEAAYHRVQDAPELAMQAALMQTALSAEEPDDVDRLFTAAD